MLTSGWPILIKRICLIYLLILAAILASACRSGQAQLPATLPLPTATLIPEPTPTPVKPIESQPTEVPAIDAPTIVYNDIKEGQLEAPQATDDWVFTGQAGERINIVLNSEFDSYLELFAPDGEWIAGNDDNGNGLRAGLFDIPLRKSGPHTIRVRGYDGATGGYALALTGGHPTIGGGVLAGGEARSVLLSPQGFKWRYEGQKDHYLTVSLKAEDQVDTQLTLYGPDGLRLAQDDDSGGGFNPEIFEFQLPEDGSYTIQAQTTRGAGLVTLNLNSSDQLSGGGLLAVGQTQKGMLKPGRSHTWSFEGKAGQIINISMSSANFDTFLELRDAQGAILAENDDSPGGSDALINLLALPADGAYTIIARGVSAQAGGEYDLTMKLAKVAAGGGLLTPDRPTQALLTPGQLDTWTFEAPAGSFLTVKLQSELLDTYIELYGPGETLLVEDDDSGGGLNAALLDVMIPEAAEYRLVVKSAREEPESGVYTILLAITEDLASTGTLAAGDSLERSLEPGEQHTWTFEAEEDYFVTVRMEAATLDTYLALYNNAGVLLAVNDDFLGKQAAIANFIVPRDDTYRLVARAYSAEEAGDYTISLEVTKEALPLSPSQDEASPAEVK